MTNMFKNGLIFLVILNFPGCDLSDQVKQRLFSKKYHREINTVHPFEIEGCGISYRGKSLSFNVPIEEWTAVLGNYDRHPIGISTAYVWDSFGLMVRVNFNTQKVSSLEWFYHRESSESLESKSNPKNYVDGMKGVKRALKIEDAWPKDYFSKSIRLDGILMDKQLNIEYLNDTRIKNGLTPFHRSMWGNAWVNLRNCPGMELNFRVDPNDTDESKVDSLRFSNVSIKK